MNYNHNNACRLCTQESSRLRPLFSDNEDIISKLRILAPGVEVTAVEGLSNNVCERCVTQLNSSCEFKILLEATYASLKERWQIQDAAFNEVLYIKDEPIPDEIAPEVAAIEVNETREAANGCNSELDPTSLKLEEVSNSSLSSCTEPLYQSGSLNQHGNEEIHCRECKRKFTTEAGLKAHSSCHKICQDSRGHVEHSFCCSYCDKTFNTERGLKIHSVKYHVGEQEYKCSVCNKTFTSELGLNRHVQTHTEERQHECSICKERFETGIELRLHSRNHISIHETLPNPVFACPTCEKQFATAKAMKIHRRFCSKSTIVSHADIKESTNQGSFECSYCNKLFNKEKAVQTHEIHCRKWQNSSNETLHMSFMSHSVSQYACTLCSESFSSLSDLVRHRRIHFKTHDPETSAVEQKLPTSKHESPNSSKEKDTNAVSSFARGSVTSDNLISTLKPHKFACAVCKQVFNTCKGLAVHRWRNHHEIEGSNIKLTSAKPNSTATSDKTIYQCSTCEVDFESSRALSMHRWHRHRPELQQHRSTLNYIPQRHRPGGIYMCRLCDKRFNTNKERIIHNLTYHGFKKKLIKGYSASHNTSRDPRIRNTFTCRVCMQTFTSRTLLVKHKWEMHRAKQQKANRSNQDMSVVTDSSYINNEKCFDCSICNQYFTSKRLLSKHRWYEHKYKPKKLASILSKSVPNKFKEANDSKHTCFTCKISFNSLKSLAKHKRYRHKQRNQEPMRISDVYNEITSKEHSYYLGYMCHPCDRGFKSSRALSLHNCKTHRKQGPGETDSILNNDSDTQDVEMYKCNICAQKFTTYRNLAAHALLHKHTETEYPSQKSSTAQLSHNMDLAIKSDNDKQYSSYSCPKCPCTFDDLLTFKSHQKLCGSSDANKKTGSANTSAVYSCKLCSMSFNSSSALIAHKNSHAESQDGSDSTVVSASVANTRTCTVCMQTFESEQCLATHSEAHGENQQKNCFKGETSIDNFIKPTLDQPSGANSNIQCHICSNVFKTAQEYKVHFTTIHSQNTAEKSTSLIQENDVCPQREAQSDNVNDTAERNYISCTVCSKMFASLNGFLIHNNKCQARNKKNSASENVAIATDSSENIEHEVQNSHTSCLHLNDLCCNVCQKTFRSSHGLLIHNGKVHPITDPKEGTRLEKKEGPSDTDEQIDNNEVIEAYNAENIRRNTSHSKISESHSGADALEVETRISSENQQEQKSWSNGKDKNLQTQQQDDSNVSEIQEESIAISSFQCCVCSKEFATHRNMLIHKGMAHRLQNDQTLDNSNTDIMDDSTLESTKQQCNLCPRVFKHARSLLFHKAFYHKSVLNSWNDKTANTEVRKGLEISENDKEFKELQTYPKSKMDGISPKINNKRCNICLREFRSFHGVLVHYAMTHQKHKIGDSLNEDKEENISGTASDEINTAHTQNALKFHQTESNINEDIDAQCTVCTKTLKSPHGLLIHMKKVHPSINTSITGKDSLHQCMPCGRTFINQHALSIHYTKFHCKNEGKNIMYSEIYRCSLCNATFTSLKGLGVHNARFHGIPQSEEKNESLQNILYKCKVCFKVFNKKAVLKTHVQEVHQSTAWEGQSLKQKANDPDLSTEDIDLDINTEDFDYGCVSCSKNFSSLMDLKKHSHESHKTNSDGEILDISYNKDDNQHQDDDNNDDVEREATNMTVSKPLRCPICEKVSYSSVGLKIHCKRVHQTHWSDLETSQFVTINFSDESNTADELFKCSICNKLFSSSADLQVHNETAHAAADMESMDVSFIDNSAVSHKDENALPSMDISLSESPRMHMNIERNNLKQQQKTNHESKSQDI